MAMIAHHHFSIGIACPACGAGGKISVVEEAGPPFTDAPRRTYSAVGAEFELNSGGGRSRATCRACGATFIAPL